MLNQDWIVDALMNRTEYWLIQGQIRYTNWQNTGKIHGQNHIFTFKQMSICQSALLTMYVGAAIDCGTTSQCSSSFATINQTCTTFTSSSTNGFDWKIIDLSVQLGEDSGMVNAGASWTFSHSDTTTNSHQACTSAQQNQ
jgi:hypothetical protein